ncbi:MAG: histidine phosphotransferase [Rhodobacteraceae bacterium]|nr:histidine phosphotransferase [Paracoccaceae bacterium]
MTTSTTRDLNALLGSRICHDLISPLGAIGNGIELLSMSGLSAAPEIALIAESVENANARIRFFRVAFGAASPGQVLARSEILSILGDLAKGARIEIEWQPSGAVARAEAKLAFLLLQCVETALPWGGRVLVSQTDACWHIHARADRTKDAPELWRLLRGAEAAETISSADVHFALAHEAAAQIGRTIRAEVTDGSVQISF